MADKYAIVLYTDERVRMFHALQLANQLERAGADFELIFAGKAVAWLPKFGGPMRRPDGFVRAHRGLFDNVREHVRACRHSAQRFDIMRAIDAFEIETIGEGEDGVLPLGTYLLEGWRVVNF